MHNLAPFTQKFYSCPDVPWRHSHEVSTIHETYLGEQSAIDEGHRNKLLEVELDVELELLLHGDTDETLTLDLVANGTR